MIVATDLDGTLLPDSTDNLDESLRELLALIETRRGWDIGFVTGRSLAGILDAIKTHRLPVPLFAVAEVGTRLYRRDGVELREMPGWPRSVHSRNPDWSWDRVVELINGADGLTLQEPCFQNPLKASWYLEGRFGETELRNIRSALESDGPACRIIHSRNDSIGRGFLDILPFGAGKAPALLFALNELGLAGADVVYCGDSGNDYDALCSQPMAVAVRNSSKELRAKIDAGRAGPDARGEIYMASGQYGLEGSHAGGILEGLVHFGLLKPDEIPSGNRKGTMDHAVT